MEVICSSAQADDQVTEDGRCYCMLCKSIAGMLWPDEVLMATSKLTAPTSQ